MRTCLIEIDKTVDTEWPPTSVEHRGATHDLTSIYAGGGIQLDVRQGSADLPLPSTGSAFDLAQLHRFMLQHRSTSPSGWHAHILIVPSIQFISNWRVARPIGVMYDSRTADENSTPREGCAMSYRAVSGMDDRAYLRTLAHELGHTFNLAHPKHDRPVRPVGTTVMNQTADLRQVGKFPGNISYEFTDHARRWLSTGPTEYVRPGGRPFNTRPAGFTDQLVDEDEPETPGLELTVSLRREQYGLGEPVYLRFSLRNGGARPITVASELSLHTQTIQLDVIDPSNRIRTFRPTFIACADDDTIRLRPGQEVLGSSAIFLDAYGQVFASPGRYELRARYRGSAGRQRRTAYARPLAVEIRTPDSAAELTLADEMSSPDMGLFLVLGGASHLARAARVWREIAEIHAEAPFVQVVRGALAHAELSAHRGKAAGRRALQLLRSANPADLDYEQVAEQCRLTAIAALRLGLGEMADEAGARLREAAERMEPAAGRRLVEPGEVGE